MAAPEQAPQAQEGVEFELDLSALVDGRLPDHLLQQLSQGADVTLPPQATPGPGEGAQGPTSRPPGDQEQRADKADDGQSSGSASASLAAAVERLSQLSAPTRHGADVLHTVDGDTLPTRRQPASPPAPHQEASLRRSEAHEGEDTPSDPGAALWARSQGWQARREAKLASLRAAKEEAEAAEVKGGFQPRLAPGTRRRRVQGTVLDRVYKWKSEKEQRLHEARRAAKEGEAQEHLTFHPDTRKNKDTLKWGPGRAPPPSTDGVPASSSAAESPPPGPSLDAAQRHALRARQQSDVEAWTARMQKAREVAQERAKQPSFGTKYTGRTTVPKPFKLSGGRRRRQGGGTTSSGGRRGAAPNGYAKRGPATSVSVVDPVTGKVHRDRPGPGARHSAGTSAPSSAPAPPVGAAYAKYAADVAQLVTSPSREESSVASGVEPDAPGKGVSFARPSQDATGQGRGSSLGTYPATPPPGHGLAWGVTFAPPPEDSPPPPPRTSDGLRPLPPALDITSPAGATPGKGQGQGGFVPTRRHVPTPGAAMPPDAEAAHIQALSAAAAAVSDAPEPPSPPHTNTAHVSWGGPAGREAVQVHRYDGSGAPTPSQARQAPGRPGATPRYPAGASTATAGHTPFAGAHRLPGRGELESPPAAVSLRAAFDAASSPSPQPSRAPPQPAQAPPPRVQWEAAVASPPQRPGPARVATPGVALSAARPEAGASPSFSLDNLTAQLAAVRQELEAERQRAADIRSMAEMHGSSPVPPQRAAPPTPAPPPPRQ